MLIPSAVKAAPHKHRVLIVCAHEPNLDPRLKWQAESASPAFDVTVLGFNREGPSSGAEVESGAYRVVRLRRRDMSALRYFWRLKDVLSLSDRFGFLLALTLMLPFIALSEAAVLLVKPLLQRLISLASSVHLFGHNSSSTPAFSDTALLHTLRKRTLARLYYIVAVLRARFAPGVVVFWRQILTMPEKPDVIHCNDLDTLLVGVLAKKHFGCRLIYDAHEFYPFSDPDSIWLDIKVFSVIEQLLVGHADAVVTVNPILADLMRTAYGLGTVYAVPNAEPWVEGRRQTGVNPTTAHANGRVSFLFQGRFASERGINEIVQAWAKVNGDKAVLFLRGPHNIWRQAAIDLAMRLGILNKSVFFLDAVTEDQLVEAARDGDVGIVPYKPATINDRFCCPNKLSQYLHAGLMVISNDLPFVKSVIEEAQAGLSYSSADLSSFVDLVHRIADDPDLLRRSQANALKYARETFNWQLQGSLFHSLYATGLPAGKAAGVRLECDHAMAAQVCRRD